jgi:ferredoxin--NADP+ reductase
VTPSFEAGQFFNLALSLEGDFERRAYSAASCPGQQLEFFVALVDTGSFSPGLFSLNVGDRIWVEDKPQGFFTLRYVPPATDLWCIATGTGLGPFIALLRNGAVWERFERVVVVHGVRGPEQLAYQEELASLAEARPLTVVRCFSRAAAPPTGVNGRVTESLAAGELERAASLELDPRASHVLLCGNPEMVKDMLALLAGRGLRRHRLRKPGHVTIEKYW